MQHKNSSSLLEIPGHKSLSAQQNVFILCLVLLAWGVWCSKLKLIALAPTEGGGSCDFLKICVCVCQCELHYGRRDVWLPRQMQQVSSSQMRVLNSAKCVNDGFKNNKSDHGACTSLLTRDWEVVGEHSRSWDEIHHCLPVLWAWGGMENLWVSDDLINTFGYKLKWAHLSTLIIICSLCSCWDLSLWQRFSCCVLNGVQEGHSQCCPQLREVF